MAGEDQTIIKRQGLKTMAIAQRNRRSQCYARTPSTHPMVVLF